MWKFNIIYSKPIFPFSVLVPVPVLVPFKLCLPLVVTAMHRCSHFLRSLHVRRSGTNCKHDPNTCVFIFQAIYGSHGHHIFTTCATCAVVHHSSTPDYNEEVRVSSTRKIIYNIHWFSLTTSSVRTSIRLWRANFSPPKYLTGNVPNIKMFG